MTIQRTLARSASLLLLCVLFTLSAFSQTKTITGKVLDDKGAPIQGATITVRGTKAGASTGADGTYHITVPNSGKYLLVSSVGFTQQEISIGDKTTIDVLLVSATTNLNEVVVIGYGTARRKDLTGSATTVSAKNFNQVPAATPDQLLQGKVAGLEVTVSNGQPGAATIVKIRGNNSIRSNTNPLYVIDGVPLDGRSARPTFSNTTGLPGTPGSTVSGVGNIPDANPLTYLNGSDIESISVLKDASASAIYGSRGANGVILITTRTGVSGPLRVEAGASISLPGLMKQPTVLNASQYRTELAKYGAASDSGASYTPFNEIIHHKLSQNYSIAISGGNSENNRYRASFLASSTPGLILKSGLDKYIANFNGSNRLLDKRLTLSYGVTVANVNEQIAPVSSNAGSTGSIISNALQWNPTLVMKHSALNYTVNPNGQVNPLAFSDGYNDYANVTTLLGNFTAGYKILPGLEYKFLYGANYSTGTRKNELLGWVSGTGGNNVPDATTGLGGEAAVGGTQLFSQTLTHTLTYTKSFNDLNFVALGGYEYYTTSYKTQFTSTYGFDYNNNLSHLLPIHLYDNMQDGLQKNLTTNSSNDPTADLQSYFARVQFNYKEKYSLTASFRADGSSKFGSNNRYAYFPALSGRWNISDENFLKDSKVLSTLALRVGWGKTGNQEFPAGAAQDRYQYTSSGNLSVINFANPNLKWETITASNAGLDFGFLKGRLTGSIEFFSKKTTNPIFPGTYPTPAPAGTYYQNLPGYITNKGGELALNAVIIQTKDLYWSIGGTLEYVKNKFVYPAAGTAPLVLAGQLNGKGTSATYVQAIANGQPIDVFFLRKFHGFDQNGFAITDGAASYAGDPNPKYIVGLSTELDYKAFALTINMHGAFDYQIYNNTLQSVIGLSFIGNGSNISKTLIGTQENTANPVSASTRYLSSGNYMKLGNATLRYKLGDVGKFAKNISVYFSGSNLFVITKYKGFDPEVNTSTLDINSTGIPSRGIDYISYPTVRNFTLGVNFSLY